MTDQARSVKKKLKCAVLDLIEDWSTKSKPDIFHFVPYTWEIEIVLKEFELMTLTNEWNWIDCFGQTPENGNVKELDSSISLIFKSRE